MKKILLLLLLSNIAFSANIPEEIQEEIKTVCSEDRYGLGYGSDCGTILYECVDSTLILVSTYKKQETHNNKALFSLELCVNDMM